MKRRLKSRTPPPGKVAITLGDDFQLQVSVRRVHHNGEPAATAHH
jgi:hypothetical protein